MISLAVEWCSAGACTSHVRQADEQQASSQIIKSVTRQNLPHELSSCGGHFMLNHGY